MERGSGCWMLDHQIWIYNMLVMFHMLLGLYVQGVVNHWSRWRSFVSGESGCMEIVEREREGARLRWR